MRGLQVVSFVEGADKPKLVGRVQATGNYPDDMYYDQANDRLLVLERLWHGDNVYREEQSRILIYDVRNPAEPKISEVIPFAGEVYDSRLVGDILYTVGSLRPNNQYDSDAKAKGLVQSFRLSKKGVKLMQKFELSLSAVYGDNLNIVTADENGKTKYYLTAVVAESSWAWFDRQTMVEVVDISDEAGQIKSIMVASVKGFVRERSSTSVKNRTLIVTSNYMLPGGNNRGVARVAVETFKFPETDSTVLTEKQSAYRQARIEHELDSAPNAKAREELTEKILSHPEYGIRGIFVKAENTLRKIVADSSVTVGDTTGQSASLQDVRYEGDLLYVFWVPANQIDPFDLFDISSPEKGIQHLGRLQFDGWIERSIPMTVQGRKFVIGLGYVNPAVNNENNRRHPQVMLFEIVNVGGQMRALDVAKLTLSQENGWANFNAADKFIEVRLTEEGKGEIMFQVSSWQDNRYLSGGQIVSFDINEYLRSSASTVFKEGGLLVGDSGWLRRVFTNPEIERVNTFTDQSLGVFPAASLGSATGIVRAAATLELARNIRAYVSMTDGSTVRGLQIVSDYSYFSQKGSTELREVEGRRADDELDKVLKTTKLDGQYKSHLLGKDGRLYLHTQDWLEKKDTKNNVVYEMLNHVYKFSLQAGGVTKDGDVSWTQTDQSPVDRAMISMNRSGLLQLPGGEIIVQDGRSLRLISTGAGALSADQVRLDSSCGQISSESSVTLELVSSRLFLAKAKVLEDDTFKPSRLIRNVVTPAGLEAKSLKCGREFNIPGKLVLATDDHLITEDEGVLDMIREEKRHVFKTQKAYVSLRLTDKLATLVDQLAIDENSYFEKHQLDNQTLVYIENLSGGTDSGWGPMVARSMPWRPIRPARDESRLAYLSLDAKGFLTQEVHYLALEVKNANLASLHQEPGTKNRFAVVAGYKQVQVLRLKDGHGEPTVMELIALDERFGRKPATKVVELGGYRGYGSDSVNFTPSLESFEISVGLGGITQFHLK